MPPTKAAPSSKSLASTLRPDSHNAYHHSRLTRTLVWLWEFFRPVLIGVTLFTLACSVFLLTIYLEINLLVCFAIAIISCIGLLFFCGWLLIRIRFWTWSPLHCSRCNRYMHKKVMPDLHEQFTVFYICEDCHTYLNSQNVDD